MSDKLIKTSAEIASADKFLRKIKDATEHTGGVIAVTASGIVDRTGWPLGPWDGEPDRKEWFIVLDGIVVRCLAVRLGIGSWVGHVAVPRDHFWHPSNSDRVKIPDENDSEVFAHGYPVVRTESIEDGMMILDEPVDCTVAFDCGQIGDLAPFDLVLAAAGRPDLPPPVGKVYRPLAYVVSEVELLAQKLVNVEKMTRGMVDAVMGRRK